MQKTPGDSPEERAEYWTGVIEDARKYRAGVSAYLRDKGLQKNNYYQWYKKLRKQHPEWNDLEGPKTRELKSRKPSVSMITETLTTESLSEAFQN